MLLHPGLAQQAEAKADEEVVVEEEAEEEVEVEEAGQGEEG